MPFTTLELPTTKLSLPYEINSSLDRDFSIKHGGFMIYSPMGFYPLNRALKLQYVELSQAELDAFDVFSIDDPYTIFTIQLTRTEPYTVGKPQEIMIAERSKMEGVNRVKVFDLSFSVRIFK